MKRFKIGNAVVNLGQIERANIPNPLCFYPSYCGYQSFNPTYCIYQSFEPITIPKIPLTLTGCGINYSTLPQTTFITDKINPTELLNTTRVNAQGVGEVVDPLETLKMLKDDLKAQLVNVEMQEKQLEDAAKPQSLEEANALEDQLEAALNEVKTLKKVMKSKK